MTRTSIVRAATALGPSVVLALSFLPAGGAQAQDSAPNAQRPPVSTTPAPAQAGAADGGSDQPLQEVVVTATGTNIAGITPVGSESLSLSRDQILDTGLTDLHDVLRALPQVVDVAPAGVVNYREGGTAAYGGDLTQGTAINLRGLGPQATLVLVDGHRVAPTGTAGVFTDADQLPLAALSRVEIITDGNSAIYGSDAIGGVVNYVMRKDLNGVEATARGTWDYGYSEYGGSITGGHTWDSLGPLGQGNFILSLDYDHRGAMRSSSSPLLADDLTAYGGVDNRIRGSSVTTGAVNGGVGPGQPGATPAVGGGTGPIATPGAVSNVAWCDNYSAGFPPFVPPNCTSATYLYRALPTGSGVPTFAQTSATPSLADRSAESDYLGRRWRYQVAAFYNQELTSALSIFFEGFWTKRDTWTAGSQYSGTASPVVTIDPGSPFYITPPAPAGGPMVVDYATTAHGIPLWYTDNPDTNWTAITGLHASLGADWTGDLSVTVGRDKACGVCQIGNNLDAGAFQHAVNAGEIDPLSSIPLTADQLSLILGTNIQQSEMGIEDYVLKFNGSLFSLPAGRVKAAVGGEFYHNTETIANGANRTDIPSEGIAESALPPPDGYEGVGCAAPLECPPRTQPNQFAWDNINGNSRRVTSAFAELYIPIVGASAGVPLVESLSLDAAGRFDHYSDVGSTANPKLGLTWKVNRDVSLRGSWGTSFRAPSLTDTNPFVFSVKVFVPNFPNLSGNSDIPPSIPGTPLTNAAFVLGNQPDIRPERARNWSAGFDLTPHWVDHLKVSATYYSIRYTGEIFAPPVFPGALLSPQQYQLYAAYVHPVHNPANCTPGDPSTYDPALLPYVNAVGIYGIIQPSQICQIQVWLDGRTTNLGSTTQAGIDLSVNYLLDTAVGTWTANLNLDKVAKEDIAAVYTAPETDVLGTIGNLVPWRGRASIGWTRGPVSATLFGNYVGGYLNNVPIAGQPNRDVASWTTFDLNLSFDFDRLPNPGFMQGTLLSLSAQNLFDRDPPLVLGAAGTAFDANNANVYGRIVSLQLRKRF